ncbi:MAG: hypothetical protein BZY73_00355 [SAR202 cluster bacterium Casp-Chloro-G3]|nr:MAG: hypothetical protein BZY73_00355 [SAR202 cluster bacterium Casp-Chloro-G3]
MGSEVMSDENLRTMLQVTYQFRNSLVDRMNNFFGYGLALTSAVWTLAIGVFIDGALSRKAQEPIEFAILAVAAGTSSIFLLLFRWYSHWFDNQVVDLYPELLSYETSLNVPTERGISGYLRRVVTPTRQIFSSTARLTDEQRVAAVKELVQNRRVGTRGHGRIDIGVLIFILTTGIVFCLLPFQITAWKPSLPWIPIIFGSITAFFFFSFLIMVCFRFQKNPRQQDLTNAIVKVGGQPKTSTTNK